MNPPVSTEVRQRVLDMRRRFSFSEVAKSSGLSVGTVKTICSRSGVFRDNPKHRALFSLPPILPSTHTLPAVPEMPAQQRVTGDNEVDAMLWLQEVVQTGQAHLIAKAMEARKLITTPLKELEKRYMNHLLSLNPGNAFAVVLGTFGFGDLDSQAKRAVTKLMQSAEATSRFGNSLFDDTPAEVWCAEVLKGVKRAKNDIFLPDDVCHKRFSAAVEYLPHTLSDCLYELGYWHEIYWLRNSQDTWNPSQQASARECFAFWSLGQIRPRNKEEAIAVLRYMADQNCMDRSEANGILLNLVGCGT